MCDQSERANWSASILFAAASRARIYRSPVVAKGSTAIDRVFGLNMPGSFASFCRASSLWRTSQRSLFGDWIVYSDRWPDSGILLVGECYPLKTWGPHISDGGSSSLHGERWPTATAHDRKGGRSEASAIKKGARCLAREAAWPTATAGDARSSGSRSLPGSKAHAGTSLTDATERTQPSEAEKRRLNPEWVEALMGFPPGWTTIGPPEEDQNSTPANRQEPESAGPEIGND